jgi:hypothetical protein
MLFWLKSIHSSFRYKNLLLVIFLALCDAFTHQQYLYKLFCGSFSWFLYFSDLFCHLEERNYLQGFFNYILCLILESLKLIRKSSDLFAYSFETILIKGILLQSKTSIHGILYIFFYVSYSHVIFVRQHRYSNRGQTPSVTTHITRSNINTPMF